MARTSTKIACFGRSKLPVQSLLGRRPAPIELQAPINTGKAGGRLCSCEARVLAVFVAVWRGWGAVNGPGLDVACIEITNLLLK